VRISLKMAALVALLAGAAGFAAGWAWRRHSHPTAAEKFDEAAKGLRQGLFGQ
jgi:hypothetical protein